MRHPSGRRRARPFSVLVVLLVIAVFAALGFRVGRSERVSSSRATGAWASAAATAYFETSGSSYRLAWKHSYDSGLAAGTAAARAQGSRAGRAAASAKVAAGADAARALAAALPLAPIRLTPSTTIDKCVPVGGGLCEVLGPSVTGKPCPSGSIPNPEGGVVCVPRVLALAARLAGAAGGASRLATATGGSAGVAGAAGGAAGVAGAAGRSARLAGAAGGAPAH